MRLDADFSTLMFKLTQDEYSKLEQHIVNEGCRDALVVWNDILIDGYNRYEICQKHNIEFKTISMQFDNREAVSDWIIDNQLGKRNLTIEQKNYLIGKKYKKEKQARGGDRKSKVQNEPLKTTAEKIAEEQKIGQSTVKRSEKFADAVDVIAENAGNEIRDKILSRELDITAQEVQILAKQKPEVQKEVVEKVRSGKSIKRAIKETNKTETPPLPEGKYRVIYADPPWQYNNSGLVGAAENHYSTMSLEEILNLKDENGRKVTDLPSENSVLFLWVTSPFLPEGLEVCQKWGFDYKTSFVWIKDNVISMQ